MLLDCRGVMERDQRCNTVRINQRSQQTVNRQRFHKIQKQLHQTHTECLPHYSPTTSVNPTVVLGHGLSLVIYRSLCQPLLQTTFCPARRDILFCFSLLSSPPSSTCNNIQLPHMDVLMSEFISSISTTPCARAESTLSLFSRLQSGRSSGLKSCH